MSEQPGASSVQEQNARSGPLIELAPLPCITIPNPIATGDEAEAQREFLRDNAQGVTIYFRRFDPTYRSSPSRMAEPYLVEFQTPDDPENPKNWGQKRKWVITVSLPMMGFAVTWANSIFAVAIGTVQEDYQTDKVTATLRLSLFVLLSLLSYYPLWQQEALTRQFLWLRLRHYSLRSHV